MKLYTIPFAIAVALALAGCGGAGSSSATVAHPAGSFYGTWQADIVNPSNGSADIVVGQSGQLTGTISGGGSLTGTLSSTATVSGTVTLIGVTYPYRGYSFQQGPTLDISGYVTDAQGHTWALNFDLTQQ